MTVRHRHFAIGLVVMVVGLGLMLSERRGDPEGRQPVAAVEAPEVLLAPYTDSGSALFEDVTEASGIAGAIGSARLTALPGPDARALADELEAASTFERLLATETYFATGQAWGDHDGDGDLDVYLTDAAGPNRLLDNDGAGIFTPSPHADDVAAADQVSGSAVWVDYDDDGRPDLHVLGNGADRLFHNLGDEGFEDVTVASGLDDPGMGQAAAWGDVDGDGNLDVYVADAGCRPCESPVPAEERQPDRLFLSRGDGTFADASASVRRAVRSDGLGMGAAWLDHDGDGDLDLYVVNDVRGDVRPRGDTPGNVLLRNDGPGCRGICFTDVSRTSGAGVRADGHGLVVADLEADGDPDLLVTNGGWQAGPTLLLVNQGDGTFLEAGAQHEANVGEWAWGASSLDADGDGRLDLLLATGLSEQVLQAPAEDLTDEDLADPSSLRETTPVDPPAWPVAEDPHPRTDNARLLLQGDDGRFATTLLGSPDVVAPVHQGVAVGDLQGDGRPDLLLGALDAGYALLDNAGDGGHRLVVDVVGDGRRLPVDPVGTTVVVTDDAGRTQARTVQVTGDARSMIFGFGDARPARIEVRWSDGEVEVLDVAATDARVRVTADVFFAYPARVTTEPLPPS